MPSDTVTKDEIQRKEEDDFEHYFNGCMRANKRIAVMTEWLRCNYMHGDMPCMKCGFVGKANLDPAPEPQWSAPSHDGFRARVTEPSKWSPETAESIKRIQAMIDEAGRLMRQPTDICKDCGGAGALAHGIWDRKCSTCNGSGKITR